MLLVIRLAAFAAFYGLALVLPGFLLGRAVVGRRGGSATVVGVLGVMLLAVALGFVLHAKVSRPVLAMAGAVVAIGSAGVLRRREAGRPPGA